MKIFENIGELVTLTGVAKANGRRPQVGQMGLIKKAALVTHQGRILWRGPQSKLHSKKNQWPQFKKAKTIDLQGRTVTPGFVEAHTHSVFAGDRSHEFEQRNKGISYEAIAQRGGGILSTVKATRKASLDQLTDQLHSRVAAFVQQGVTTLEIKSGYGLTAAAEIKMLKAIRSVKRPQVVSTFLGAHALPPEFPTHAKYVDYLIEKVIPKIAKQKLADRADIFIEKGYFSPPLAEKYLRACAEQGMEICAHTEQLHRTGGFIVANKLNALSIEHAVELTVGDINKLSRSSIVAVLLPGADFYLKMPYPKARAMIDAGMIVALATDFNPGSCPTQDLSLIGVLARLEMKMSLPEVLSAYTLNGAKALGLESEAGSLCEGKWANFAVLDDSWDRLFYQVGYHPVHSTFWKSRKIF